MANLWHRKHYQWRENCYDGCSGTEQGAGVTCCIESLQHFRNHHRAAEETKGKWEPAGVEVFSSREVSAFFRILTKSPNQPLRFVKRPLAPQSRPSQNRRNSNHFFFKRDGTLRALMPS